MLENIKNAFIALFLVIVDHPVVFAGVAIFAGLERVSSYGATEFWAMALILVGVFGFLFAIAWKRDKGYYRWF